MPKAKIEFLQASWLDIDRISDFYLREVGPVSAEKAIDDMIRDFNTSIDKLFAEKEVEIMKI